MTGLRFPKPRPAALERAEKRRARQTADERENAKVKARSYGRCEVAWSWTGDLALRCDRRAMHIHHMLGGIGVRGRGESAKAIRKQHVCTRHHANITAHVLQRIGDAMPHWTDHYRRLK